MPACTPSARSASVEPPAKVSFSPGSTQPWVWRGAWSAGFAQPADHAPRHTQGCVDPGEKLTLAGGSTDAERALGVQAGIDEAVEIDLRAGEIDDGDQPAGELLV